MEFVSYASWKMNKKSICSSIAPLKANLGAFSAFLLASSDLLVAGLPSMLVANVPFSVGIAFESLLRDFKRTHSEQVKSFY